MNKKIALIVTIALSISGLLQDASADPLEQTEQQSKHIRCTPYPECVLIEGQTIATLPTDPEVQP